MKFHPEKGASSKSSIRSMYPLQIARIAGNCQTLPELEPRFYRASLAIKLGWEPRFSFSAMSGNFADSGNFIYPCPPRSSFRRMFTKLYGGHGPVYLKFRRSPNF